MVIRQPGAVDEGGCEYCLDELLLGVVEEPGVGDHGKGGESGLGLAERGLALGEELRDLLGLSAVDRLDGWRCWNPGSPRRQIGRPAYLRIELTPSSSAWRALLDETAELRPAWSSGDQLAARRRSSSPAAPAAEVVGRLRSRVPCPRRHVGEIQLSLGGRVAEVDQ